MKHILLSFGLAFALNAGFAQVSDSLSSEMNAAFSQLLEYERAIQRYEAKHREDSLKRLSLLQEMEGLRRVDLAAQSKLLEELHLMLERDSLQTSELEAFKAAAEVSASAFPVVLEQDTIFYIYAKFGASTARERAEQVTRTLKKLSDISVFEFDSLKVVSNELTAEVMYGPEPLLAVTDWDVLWLQAESKEAMAIIYKNKIEQYFEDRGNPESLSSFYELLLQFGLVALILFSVAFILFILNRYISKAERWLVKTQEKYLKGVRFGTYEFLSPELQLDFFTKFINILKWVAYLIVLYLALPLLFSVFPFTRTWAEVLLSWILDPAKEIFISIWNYLPNVFTIAVIFVITRYASKLLKFLAHEVDHGKLKINRFHADWALPTYKIVKFLLYAFMFVVIFPYLPGSDSEIFRGVSVFLGILFSLGSSSAIANAVAGLVITYMRPFKLGDRVTIGQVSGEVIEKSLLVTRVRTTKNEDITVPNSSILNGHTINYSSSSEERGLILHTTVTIGYDVPWRKVHHMLIEAAAATEGINITREPFVLQTSLDDFYVSYQLNAYTDMPEKMALIYSDLHGNIQDFFQKENIEIMSPHYRAERDGTATTVPAPAPKS